MNLRSRKVSATFLIVPLLLIVDITPTTGLEFRRTSRLKLISGYDDNIFEEANERKNDEVVGILLSLNGKWVGGAQGSLGLDYQGGYYKYWSYSCETRCIHEFMGWGKIRFSRNGTVGLRGTMRYKNYPNSDRDNWLGNGEIWLQLALPKGISGKLYYYRSFLDYASYEFFDFNSNRGGISLAKRISGRLLIGIGSSFDRVIYRRDSFDYSELINEDLVVEKGKQIDHLYQVTLFLEYYRGFLLKMDYSFERNNSNSFGYSYRKHHILLVFAKNLLYRSMIKLFFAQQFKTYLESTDQLLLLNLDTEGEQDNIFVAELSRGFSSQFGAFLRFHWTKNESLVRDRLYEKKFTSIGIEYQFE